MSGIPKQASHPRVFISYSHDSRKHSRRVLDLANSLRSYGVDAQLDRYHIRPPHGWPQWCEAQLRPVTSDFVLMICTQTYLARVENRVPADEGRGVFWEGSLIYSYIYDDKENHRFIPVLLPGSQEEDIPRPLRDHSWYRVEGFTLESPGYEMLYRELTRQQEVIMPPLGKIVAFPPLPVREARSSFPPPMITPNKKPRKLFGRKALIAAVSVLVTGVVIAIPYWRQWARSERPPVDVVGPSVPTDPRTSAPAPQSGAQQDRPTPMPTESSTFSPLAKKRATAITIEITAVPPDSQGGPNRVFSIGGVTDGVGPEDFRVVVYAFDGQLWWIQPDAENPWTEIATDGSWSTRTRWGVRYAALLVRDDARLPDQTGRLPQLDDDVLARDEKDSALH